MSEISIDALLRAFLVAGTGPHPIVLGATPAAALEIQVAIGVRFNSAAFSSVSKIIEVPSSCLHSTGTISSLKRPKSMAEIALLWLWKANLSCS